MTNIDMMKLAREASEKSYSPYSNVRVGAALETASGKIYTGCNVENGSYAVTWNTPFSVEERNSNLFLWNT